MCIYNQCGVITLFSILLYIQPKRCVCMLLGMEAVMQRYANDATFTKKKQC